MKNQFKKITCFLCFAVIIQLIIGCKSSDDKIIGDWSGTSNGNNPHPICVTLDKTSHASWRVGNAVVGGKNDNSGPWRKIELVYKVDYSRTPYIIDFAMIVDDFPSKEPFIKGIFRFISDNKMEIRTRLDGERFTNFDSSDKENQIVLERKI